MKARIIVGMLLLSSVVAARCWAPPLEPQNQEIKLPAGFSGAAIGMSVKELLQLRKNARPLPDWDEEDDGTKPKKAPTSYVELQMKHPLFDSVLYLFKKNALDSVVFQGTHRAGFVEDVNRDFVSEIVRLYGKSSALGVTDLYRRDGEDRKAALFWRKGPFLIVAFFPVIPLAEYLGRSQIDLKISRVKSPDYFGYEYPRITRAQEKKLLAPIRARLKGLLPAQAINETNPPVDRTMRAATPKSSGVPAITSPIMVPQKKDVGVGPKTYRKR